MMPRGLYDRLLCFVGSRLMQVLSIQVYSRQEVCIDLVVADIVST